MKNKFNYQKSILNLMSSVQASFGINSKYTELSILKGIDLNKTENVVLLIIDGLGYEYLVRKSKSKFLINNLKDRLSSVFLATTATNLTSFFTGLSPNEHLITGWRIYLREIGMASELLSFKTRSGKIPLEKYGLKMKDFYKAESIFSRINKPSFVVYPESLADSCFSNIVTKGANVLTYKDLPEMFEQTRNAIFSSKKRKYIFSYWQGFDSICHKFGTATEEVRGHFQEIENGVKKFMDSVKDKNVSLIITADHGLIDYKKEDIIHLDDHPNLSKMLTVPLCGEARVAYCYVKSDQAKQFERYVKTYLKKYCWIKKSRDIIEEGWFGPYAGNDNIRDRIGDYVLIMKKNYVIQDSVLSEPQMAHLFKACHSGISDDEMYVPLIVINSMNAK